jgi:hypothetical protein
MEIKEEALDGTLQVNLVGDTINGSGCFVSLKSRLHDKKKRNPYIFLPIPEYSPSLLTKRSREDFQSNEDYNPQLVVEPVFDDLELKIEPNLDHIIGP